MSDARPPPGERLCALADLPDPGARSFVFGALAPEGGVWGGEGEPPLFRGFVVRTGETVRGYLDACPHVGAPLSPDGERYLTRRGDFLMCFNHGALFRLEDGLCVAGPCVKRSLRPWPVEVRDGEVVTAAPEEPSPPCGERAG